jgi:hypothetical protein
MTAHLPSRPTWNCAGCGAPWPCPSRRGQLLAEYEGASVSLALFMTANFVEAASDLSWVSAGDLYGRFFSWLHERRPPQRVTREYGRDDPTSGRPLPDHVDGYAPGRHGQRPTTVHFGR